jgi:hypothetical protein
MRRFDLTEAVVIKRAGLPVVLCTRYADLLGSQAGPRHISKPFG